jgi:hypothetical protein
MSIPQNLGEGGIGLSKQHPLSDGRYLVPILETLEDAAAAIPTGSYTCLSGDAVGDWVYVSASNTVAKADADDTSKRPARGVITSKPTATTCNVQFSGEAAVFTGLTAGTKYYLSATAAGAMTATAPSGHKQLLGVAKNTTTLIMSDDSAAFETSALGVIDLPASSFYLLTGAPLAVFADGTTTVPGSAVEGGKCFGIRWNNDAAPAAITRDFQIPPDLDTTVDATFHGRIAKTGATNNAGNTTTLTVGLFNQANNALYDADTNFGGVTSAILPAATAKTIQDVTLTITAADLAAYPASGTITIKPTAGTLDTDDLVFVGAYITYTKRVRK